VVFHLSNDESARVSALENRPEHIALLAGKLGAGKLHTVRNSSLRMRALTHAFTSLFVA
jgi:hypothetical protein